MEDQHVVMQIACFMHTAFLQLGLACSSCHRRSICDDERMFNCSHVPYRGIIRSLCVFGR